MKRGFALLVAVADTVAAALPPHNWINVVCLFGAVACFSIALETK